MKTNTLSLEQTALLLLSSRLLDSLFANTVRAVSAALEDSGQFAPTLLRLPLLQHSLRDLVLTCNLRRFKDPSHSGLHGPLRQSQLTWLWNLCHFVI